MKYIAFVLAVLISSTAFAALTTKTIVVRDGEQIDIAAEVVRPCTIAIAEFAPPAIVNGKVTSYIAFADGISILVSGPTTVTLRYGDIEQDPDAPYQPTPGAD